MLVCTLGGEGSEKVYCLYTHENVDIFGWSLTIPVFMKTFLEHRTF